MNGGKKRVRMVRLRYNETRHDLTTSMYNIDPIDETLGEGLVHMTRSQIISQSRNGRSIYARQVATGHLRGRIAFRGHTSKVSLLAKQWLSGILALRVHMRLASNQGIPRDHPLNDNVIGQLVQRVYMANEQCFNRPLIRFDLGDGRDTSVHWNTHRDRCVLDGRYVGYISGQTLVVTASKKKRIYPCPSSQRRQTCTTVPDEEFGSWARSSGGMKSK